jgi:hypothetical protein
MSRTLLHLILVLLISSDPAAAGFGADIIRKTPLLRDGFVMMGADGKLIGPDSNDVRFFELASDVNDYRAVIKAGTRLELLPSSTLEKMSADKKMRTTSAYRLWNSRVTRYKGRNFIFPGYFMPLSKAGKTEPEQLQEPQLNKQEPSRTQSVQDLNEPNDILAMPKEIVEKLRARRPDTRYPILDARQESRVRNKASGGPDLVFVDRTGFLIRQDDGLLVFVPDALGRNVQKLSLHLLPCAILELAELKQAAEPEVMRFKIAGIMTKYKGDNYLLLEKATLAYSHGNFGR